MRLTVLGNPDRYLARLSGGSSYLVETATSRILLDAGHGTRDALARAGDPRLDAVWVSHTHFDHLLDLPTLPLDDDVPIVLGTGGRARLDALAAGYAWEEGWDHGRIREVAPGDALDLGGARWAFAPNHHSTSAFALRLESEGRALVYASDTAATEALADLARGADLLLMHTLLPDVEAGSRHARFHATARSAGRLARDAGVRRLLLSHRYHESNDDEMLAAARESHADVVLATQGGSYEV